MRNAEDADAMPKDLYKVACRTLGDVRAVLDRKAWGGLEKQLLDTDRGLRYVLRFADNRRDRMVFLAPSRSFRYVYGRIYTRAEARVALEALLDRRLDAARDEGDEDTVLELDGRIDEFASRMLDEHPAYHDAPDGPPPSWLKRDAPSEAT